MMTLALSVLGAAAVFIVLATLGLIRDSSLRKQARRAAAQTIDWPPTWAEILAANGGWPPARNHKHNVHCPTCGRFSAKRTEFGPNTRAMECRYHGLFVRMDIAWT